MRIPVGFLVAASGFMAVGATAQTMAPPPPPPGSGMMRADANHDGVVTRAEMVADADARFSAMDTNKDGTVTGDERAAARAAMWAQRHGGGERPAAQGGRDWGSDRAVTRAETLDRAGKRFDRLDSNHDGKLDATELAAARPMRGSRRGGETAPAPAPASSPDQ